MKVNLLSAFMPPRAFDSHSPVSSTNLCPKVTSLYVMIKGSACLTVSFYPLLEPKHGKENCPWEGGFGGKRVTAPIICQPTHMEWISDAV